MSDESRRDRLQVRMTPEVYARIEAAAARMGMTKYTIASLALAMGLSGIEASVRVIAGEMDEAGATRALQVAMARDGGMVLSMEEEEEA